MLNKVKETVNRGIKWAKDHKKPILIGTAVVGGTALTGAVLYQAGVVDWAVKRVASAADSVDTEHLLETAEVATEVVTES